jgi:hypothetical protein
MASATNTPSTAKNYKALASYINTKELPWFEWLRRFAMARFFARLPRESSTRSANERWHGSAPNAASSVHHKFKLGPLAFFRNEIAFGSGGKAALGAEREVFQRHET